MDWPAERALLATLRAGIEGGHIAAAHDAADGGLGVALAEMALLGGVPGGIGDGLGATVCIPVDGDDRDRERWLFGETHGCAWIAVPEDEVAAMTAMSATHGCPVQDLGRVGGADLRITDQRGAVVLDTPVASIRAAWEGGLTEAVGLSAIPARP